MKDKLKHSILPSNTGHMNCLRVKKSSSRGLCELFCKETTQSKKKSNSEVIFMLAGEVGHPQAGWTSTLQPQTTSVHFPRHFVSRVSHLKHVCVLRAAANGELVGSKGNRNKACRLVEHHHTKRSQGPCGKCFSHLGSVRNTAANSTTCRSMKQHLETESENVFSVHSLFACCCCKYTWNCSTWFNFFSFCTGF